MNVQISPLLVASVAVFVVGIFAPFLRPNYFVGVRLPWTLRDERVWIATHRFLSVDCLVAGVFGFAVAFTGRATVPLVLVVVFGATLPAVIFSYIAHRRLHPARS